MEYNIKFNSKLKDTLTERFNKLTQAYEDQIQFRTPVAQDIFSW